MATYAELLDASQNENLNVKVRVACAVAADLVATEAASVPNHANRLLWAKSVYEDPQRTARNMVWAVIAKNKDATLAQIQGATDAAVQSAVNLSIDVFATGV